MRWQTLWEAKWILVTVVVLAAGSGLLHRHLVWPWLPVLVFTLYFFRDPAREAAAGPGSVLAAADGVVRDVGPVVESEVLRQPMIRIGIFLSVFDVHVNRAPIAGEVIYSQDHAGKFLDARNPEATRLNACRTWAIRGKTATLMVRQITGAIARRIVAWSIVGDRVAQGQRFGMIRFGSRTEIFVPVGTEILVKPGDRVKGGETIVARLAQP